MSGGAVLIVGWSGFVGAHVARALVAAGWQVHGFGPPVAENVAPDLDGAVRVHAGSVEDAAAVMRAVEVAQPRLLLCFAAYGAGRAGLMRSGEADADRALAVNVAGFRHVLEAARSKGVPRVIWASSTVVYGPPDLYEREPVDESGDCRPRTFYGLTKVMAEDVARFYRDRHGLAVTGLRLPLVIGPGLWYEGAAAELAKLFRDAAPGAATDVAGPAGPLDLMYVKDVAAAFLAAAAAPALDCVYNINGFTASYPDLIGAVQRRVPAYAVEFVRRDPPFTFPLVSSTAFEAATGFRPRFGAEATVENFLNDLERQRRK